MYIEDVGKPFLTLENKKLSKEEFFASRNYALRYFFGRKVRHGFGIFFLVILVISLLATIIELATDPTPQSYQNIIGIVFIFLCVLFLLAILPNLDEKRIKRAYETNRFEKTPYTIRFYKEYFELENENAYFKVARTDIEKCLESNQMILLKGKDGAIYTVMKSWMTESQFFVLKGYLQEVYVYHYKAVK